MKCLLRDVPRELCSKRSQTTFGYEKGILLQYAYDIGINQTFYG